MRGLEGSRLAVIAALATWVLIAGCGGADRRPPARASAHEAIEAFAPLVRIHPRERDYPISAERFIERSSLKVRAERCLLLKTVAAGAIGKRKEAGDHPLLTPARLGRPPGFRERLPDPACRAGRVYTTLQHTRPFDENDRPEGLGRADGFYLDPLMESLDGDPLFERRAGVRTLRDVPVYYELEHARIGRTVGIAIDYWLLHGKSRAYRAGDPRPNSREATWSRMTVLAKRLSERRYEATGVRLFTGSHVREVPWHDLEVAGRTHPIVYSALASHVPYESAGTFERREGKGGRSFAVEERTGGGCPRCVELRSWELLRDARRQPWYGYGGGWGLAFREDATSGPLGPSPYMR